jgi:Fe-S cluster assembly protein SufD
MHTVTLNGTLVRNNVRVRVNGTNCETNLYGAYLLKGNQHTDNHTIIDHMMPHCLSNELYKGVIDDQATAVFNGKVFVRKDAQKINAFQSNGNVLMTDKASVNSKPELEIYADDVKCSHGSTTGQLNEEAVFYLQSRGISERSARNLLVEAFIGEVLEKNDNLDFTDKTNAILNERFGWER